MRIIAGRFRGRRLSALGKGDAGTHLRPTADRVRESLFSRLTAGPWGDAVDGAVVLDLFAGTGALGLEALSRGAYHVTFVENGRTALRLLAQNIALLGCGAETRIRRSDALRPGPAEGPPAMLVFLDPPYGKGLGAPALDAARNGGWIAPGALVVWEEKAAQSAPPGFTLEDHRRYGESWVSFLVAEG
ncbi:MAG: 16S rRNA (guanine(966)-N(2))-methyltransferase RsmD [Pseudomonadota bacterium]